MNQSVTEPKTQGSLTNRLLICGIVSSLLYAAMLAFVPLWWDGYSSAAQTVSELSAIDAPTRSLWVPLGIVWTLLYALFGWGVWQAAGRNRPLRIAGAVIIAHGAFGIFWPPMHLRGTPPSLTDTLHIAWSMVTVLLMALAIGFAAAELGRRFRLYSIATLLVFIPFGILTGMDGPRISANLPTPMIGVWERINIGVWLLWVVVLALALMRRARPRGAAISAARATTQVNGMVAPGFEEVRAEFERNFAERGEIGAAVAAFWRGRKVVDLWGGHRTPEGNEPWKEDTMVVVMSSTKGLSAMTLAVANARGWIDYDAPVTRYWPEFAQNGKAAVTVRQLLGHEAGLVVLDQPLTLERLNDLDDVARLLARQKPAWTPGTRHGYHTMTIGLCMQELIRRVDPRHRTLGQFFHEEIAVPLAVEFYIGLPREVPDARLAKVKPLSPGRGLLALRYTPPAVTLKMITPGSLLRRSFSGLAADPTARAYLDVEVPAGNGVGTARAIARAYSAFAEGGTELGITPETFARITEPPVVARPRDEVIGVPSYFSLGFLRPGPEVAFGSSQRAFGSPGAGGSFGFADPDAHLGYAYVMNKLDFYLVNDPREKALRDAIYRAIARLTIRPEGGGERTRDRMQVPTSSAR
jgi:CubicO group peptidase (beta-lactamase class C family)